MAAHEIAFANEVGQGLADDELPAYAPMLAAYQRSHARELREMIGALPLRPGDRVLDMACGAGVYSRWLAERVGPGGLVVGADISRAFLEQARAQAVCGGRLAWQIGDIAGLPFADGTFDLVWCAQSMYSLPDPLAALRELARVTRPGGTVAVFENDMLHHLVLPWPAELELAVRQAQLQSVRATASEPAKFFIGRELCAVFAEAGLCGCQVRPYSAVRQAPLGPDERRYLASYLRDLGQRARPLLEPGLRARFDELVAPGSPGYLLDQPGFYVTYIDMLACATV